MSWDLRRRRKPIHVARGDAYAQLRQAQELYAPRAGVCMLQHDYNAANASGAAFRADLNNLFSAIVSNNSGSSAPSTTFAYMTWYDTTANLKKQRNAANSAWITVGTLDETPVEARSSNTIIGASDYGKTFICTSTFTQTLTAAATLATNFHFYIRNNGTGVITLDPNSSETVDGRTTILIYPGESFKVVCDGSNWFTVGRSKIVTLSDTTAANVATVDSTLGFADTEIAEIEISFHDVIPATDTADLWLRIGTGAGPSFASGAADYNWSFDRSTDSSTQAAVGDNADAQIDLAQNLGSTAGETCRGKVSICAPSLTAGFKEIQWRASTYNSVPNGVAFDGAGRYLATTAITGLRIMASTGNINGRFVTRGIRF